MPSPESLDLARLFLRKGNEDLDAARILSAAGRTADSIVGFHAQQAVEKLVTAVLAAHGVEVPKTHDLRFLFEVASSNGVEVPEEVQDTRWLTPWSVEFRYGDELSEASARAAAARAIARGEREASFRVGAALLLSRKARLRAHHVSDRGWLGARRALAYAALAVASV